jgi:hypothetical protein
MAMATLPDVCKTPSPGGPVPIPYPNIARSSDLAKGTKTVHADGGNSIAVKNSEFSRSQGDEAGTAGGIKSSTFTKEATWLSYSMDVKFEGENACRLTDKMLMNHGNTACMAGLIQQLLEVLQTEGEVAVLCEIVCHCEQNPAPSETGRSGYQQCMENKLTELDEALGGNSTMKPEIPYNMLKEPPEPISKHWMFHDHLKPKRPGNAAYVRGDVRVPDVVLVKNPKSPATQDNLRAVVEVKFKNDPWDSDDMMARRPQYKRIAGPDAQYVELDADKCGCKDGKRQPVRVPVQVPEPMFSWKDALLLLAGAALIFTPIPGDEAVVGGAAAVRALQWLKFAF